MDVKAAGPAAPPAEHPRTGGAAIVAVALSASLLLGLIWGLEAWPALIAIGATALFAILVRDIRVIVPVLVFLFPLGPRFASGVGNLYLSTMVLALVYAAWLWRGAAVARPYTIFFNRVVIAVAIYQAVVVLSAMQTLAVLIADRSDLLRLIQLIMYSGFFALVLSMPFSRVQIKAILVAVLAAGLTEAVVGLALWPRELGLFVAGTFEGGHSDFAVYALLIAGLLLGVVLEARRTAVIAAGLGALAVVVTAIALSYSRGGYAASLACLLCFFAMPLRRRRKLGLGIGLVAGLAVLAVIGPKLIQERFGELASTVSLTRLPISFVHRLGMWKTVWTDFLENPILGKGTWVYYLRDNFYMRVLGETGLIGIAAFLGLLATVLREEWRAIRARTGSDFVRGVALGLFPATVGCLLVFQLSGDFFVVHRFMGVFWVVLALVLKYCLGIGVVEDQSDRRAA